MTDADLIAAAIAAVEAELGRTLTDTEGTQATQRGTNALVVIRARLGQALTGVSEDALVLVLGEVMLARSRNPDGYSSESVDDYTYRLPTETQRVTIIDEWWGILTPRGNRRRAYSVMPS
jgi:hypothetical protein